MITDKPPRKKSQKEEYSRSDRMCILELPGIAPLRKCAAQLEQSLGQENRREVQLVSNELAAIVSDTYNVSVPTVRVFGVRPLEITEDFVDETYGDYDLNTARIRLWMRTAVRRKATSFGTLLSTLCHELCHHLDVVSLDFPNTFHTRGFYERAGLLYHHVRGTPRRRLVWTEQTDGTFRINWPETMRSSPES